MSGILLGVVTVFGVNNEGPYGAKHDFLGASDGWGAMGKYCSYLVPKKIWSTWNFIGFKSSLIIGIFYVHVGSARQEEPILSEPPQGVLICFITEVIAVDYGIKLPW